MSRASQDNGLVPDGAGGGTAPSGFGSAETEIVQRLESVITLVRSSVEYPARRDAGTPHDPGSDTAITAAAKSLYRARRRRERHFEALGCAFGEPMWDLMLDLFVAERERRRVSVSSACLAADVPATTALRWLQQMEEQGLLERRDDPSDRRRAHVRLTEPTERAMERYITELVYGSATG